MTVRIALSSSCSSILLAAVSAVAAFNVHSPMPSQRSCTTQQWWHCTSRLSCRRVLLLSSIGCLCFSDGEATMTPSRAVEACLHNSTYRLYTIVGHRRRLSCCHCLLQQTSISACDADNDIIDYIYYGFPQF